MLSSQQSSLNKSPPDWVLYSVRYPCSPQPGLHILPSSFHGLPPTPPPMAESAPPSASLADQSTISGHTVVLQIWNRAACQGQPPTPTVSDKRSKGAGLLLVVSVDSPLSLELDPLMDLHMALSLHHFSQLPEHLVVSPPEVGEQSWNLQECVGGRHWWLHRDYRLALSPATCAPCVQYLICCNLLTAFWTSSSVLHFLPVTTQICLSLPHESLSSITSLASLQESLIVGVAAVCSTRTGLLLSGNLEVLA